LEAHMLGRTDGGDIDPNCTKDRTHEKQVL
jgi:hypothetical protein